MVVGPLLVGTEIPSAAAVKELSLGAKSSQLCVEDRKHPGPATTARLS